MTSSPIEAFPLTWPHPQPRTAPGQRVHAAFKVTTAAALDDLLCELDLLKTRDVVVSSSVPTRRGLLRTDYREPDDPGVAVYFDRRVGTEWRPFVVACDHYSKFRWNLRAIGVTIEALRAIQRHGASSMLEQAFTGFAALPPAGLTKAWHDVLGVRSDATSDAIRAAYVEMSRRHHPDLHPGDSSATERMAEVNRAFAEARELGRVT